MYQIFVVEDELLIRQNIRNIIENMPGPYSFCGEASDGEMALAIMQDVMPDIVLTDIRMPFLDGFELIRHAKAMMPWLKIVIISGYGDFESAQKAIALGVDQYLLKPIRAAELMQVVEKLAREIEEEKAQSEIRQGYDDNEVQYALRLSFMQKLLFGGLNTAMLLEKARALKLDIVSPCYQPVLFSFAKEEAERKFSQIPIVNLLEQMKLPLYYFSEYRMLVVVCPGQDSETVGEFVYRLIAIMRHELREMCPVITCVVGESVQRLSMVSQAYKTAADLMRKAESVAVGLVADVNDTKQLALNAVALGDPFGEEFRNRLKYASVQEVPQMVDEVLNSPEGNKFGSVLMRYYTLIEIFKMTVVQMERSIPKCDLEDIALKLSSQYDIFAAAEKKNTFRDMAVSLLKQSVMMKNEELTGAKNSPVIARALEYVSKNFADPNLSLISAARHVGLSAAHFSTVFSQAVGRSFINYLTCLRIERAKELLRNTSMKLSTIAMEIGYNEPNYFSHVFRKMENMTPKEYRQAHSGQ